MVKLNKKGASIDNLWVTVSFFGLAIFFIGLMVFWNAINTNVTDLWTGSSVGTTIQSNAQTAVNQFDWVLVVVWIGLHLGILATAFLLRTHPAVYIVAIILTAILALIAAPLSNAYEDMIAEPELSTAAGSYVKTNFIIANLPQLEIIWGFVTIIIMFGLAKMEGFV